MSITSLYSTSSSGSSRKSSLDRSSLGARKLSIELLPNQSIFRETFLGASVPRLISPVSTPIEEEAPISPATSTRPTGHAACVACHALANSPVASGRRLGAAAMSATYKRHAVILPTRHHGPHCRMPPPPTGALPALPSIGEDCLVEWERRGTMTIAHNLPSPQSSRNSTPLSSPAPMPARADYFALSSSSYSPVSRFSVDTIASSADVAPMNAMPSPRMGGGRGYASSPRIGARPSTPLTPTKEYRSFLRLL